MGYDQYTVREPVAVKTAFYCFPLVLANMSMASCAILSNFFEEQWTQNHPQYLSGLSHPLFPTTCLEIAVYTSVMFIHKAVLKEKIEGCPVL